MSEGAAGTQIGEQHARLSAALPREIGKGLVGQDEMVQGLLVGLFPYGWRRRRLAYLATTPC